jgi:hypothetical protein
VVTSLLHEKFGDFYALHNLESREARKMRGREEGREREWKKYEKW